MHGKKKWRRLIYEFFEDVFTVRLRHLLTKTWIDRQEGASFLGNFLLLCWNSIVPPKNIIYSFLKSFPYYFAIVVFYANITNSQKHKTKKIIFYMRKKQVIFCTIKFIVSWYLLKLLYIFVF